jgi:hypothetical protein
MVLLGGFRMGYRRYYECVSVFGLGGVLGHEWEEKKIKEMLDKDKTQQ